MGHASVGMPGRGLAERERAGGRTADGPSGRPNGAPSLPTRASPCGRTCTHSISVVCARMNTSRREPSLHALAGHHDTHNARVLQQAVRYCSSGRIARNAIEPMQPKRPYFLTVHAALTRLLRQRRTSVRQLHRQPRVRP